MELVEHFGNIGWKVHEIGKYFGDIGWKVREVAWNLHEIEFALM